MRLLIVVSLVAALVLALIINAIFDSKIAGGIAVVLLFVIAGWRLWRSAVLGDDDVDLDI